MPKNVSHLVCEFVADHSADALLLAHVVVEGQGLLHEGRHSLYKIQLGIFLKVS